MQYLYDCCTQLTRFLLTLFVTALFAGVAYADDGGAAGEADFDDVQEEWQEAVDSLKDYSVSQRDAAVDEAGETLEEMDERIQMLEQRTVDEWDSLSEEAREARLETLHELGEKRNELAEWYGGMKYSSTQAWGEVKQGFTDAYGVLAEAWEDALDEFDD